MKLFPPIILPPFSSFLSRDKSFLTLLRQKREEWVREKKWKGAQKKQKKSPKGEDDEEAKAPKARKVKNVQKPKSPKTTNSPNSPRKPKSDPTLALFADLAQSNPELLAKFQALQNRQKTNKDKNKDKGD